MEDIQYQANGILTFTLKNGQTLQVPIGDLISGLVSTDTFNQTVQGLSDRITTIESDYLKSTDKIELQENITGLRNEIELEQQEQDNNILSLQNENERLSRIVEGLPTKQANGISFVLNDMVKANIKDYQLRGNITQDGTPTPDSPVQIKSVKGNQEINVFGKNLFDKNSITNDSWLVENHPEFFYKKAEAMSKITPFVRYLYLRSKDRRRFPWEHWFFENDLTLKTSTMYPNNKQHCLKNI